MKSLIRHAFLLRKRHTVTHLYAATKGATQLEGGAVLRPGRWERRLSNPWNRAAFGTIQAVRSALRDPKRVVHCSCL